MSRVKRNQAPEPEAFDMDTLETHGLITDSKSAIKPDGSTIGANLIAVREVAAPGQCLRFFVVLCVIFIFCDRLSVLGYAGALLFSDMEWNIAAFYSMIVVNFVFQALGLVMSCCHQKHDAKEVADRLEGNKHAAEHTWLDRIETHSSVHVHHTQTLTFAAIEMAFYGALFAINGFTKDVYFTEQITWPGVVLVAFLALTAFHSAVIMASTMTVVFEIRDPLTMMSKYITRAQAKKQLADPENFSRDEELGGGGGGKKSGPTGAFASRDALLNG